VVAARDPDVHGRDGGLRPRTSARTGCGGDHRNSDVHDSDPDVDHDHIDHDHEHVDDHHDCPARAHHDARGQAPRGDDDITAAGHDARGGSGRAGIPRHGQRDR
jgi:hypothetical protein